MAKQLNLPALKRKVFNELPFPADHNRSDPSDYEAYRRRVISLLISAGLSDCLAHVVVDDIIAYVERHTNPRLSHLIGAT